MVSKTLQTANQERTRYSERDRHFETLMFGYYWGILRSDSRSFDLGPQVKIPVADIPVINEYASNGESALEKRAHYMIQKILDFESKWDDHLEKLDSHLLPTQKSVVENLIREMYCRNHEFTSDLRALGEETNKNMIVSPQTTGGLVAIAYYAKHYLTHPLPHTPTN